jgi:enoyl-CoA hydratase/carnithine racemase
MTTEVTTETVGRVGVITINRPEVRNAINEAVALGVEAAFDAYEAEPDIRVVVITGAGDVAFCAGMDLKAFASAPRSKIFTDRGGFAGMSNRVFTKPVLAAVNGLALGGGLEIALSCDLVIAAENAIFGIPEVKVGLIAAAGGLIRLPKRIPRVVALEMAMTGEPIDAETAERIGLVNRVAPHGKALEVALERAEKIAEASPAAVRESRELLLASLETTEAEAWALNKGAVRRVMKAPDFVEGQKAFAEKRRPEWAAT